MKYYLGLDLHSKHTTYCLQDQDGNIKDEGKIATLPEAFAKLKEIYGIPEGTRVGMESCALARLTSVTLQNLGLEPVVINAFEVRRKARRLGQKTDRRDAFEICDGLRRDIYDSIVYIPEPGIARIRAILSRRRHYVKISTMEINAAKFVLRSNSLGHLARSLGTATAWKKLMENQDLTPEIRSDLQHHYDTWQHTRSHIERFEEELKIAILPYKEIIDRLMTMPAIGLITAATYFSALGRIDRFSDSGKVVSYLGLIPSMNDSGGKEVHGGITKCGNKEVRTVLCEVAHHTKQFSNPLRPYFMRTCAKHGLKRAVVTMAHRMARVLYQIWKSGREFDPSRLNVEHVTVEKKVQQYVIRKTATLKH